MKCNQRAGGYGEADIRTLFVSFKYLFVFFFFLKSDFIDLSTVIDIDKRLYSCGIFIDLKKAFDTVDHSILLQKLHHYGFRGLINDWFSSYLSNRTQSTQIGSVVSSKERIVCGVPQGSVLGLLLFLIYVNDMYRSSQKLDFYLFADDTNLLYAEKDLKKLEIVVNEELLKLSEWLNSNKLSLNPTKSNFVVFHSYQRKLNYEININIFDNNSGKLVSLERKTYVKYLGVLLDDNLSWKPRIDYISTKISKGIGIIARLFLNPLKHISVVN